MTNRLERNNAGLASLQRLKDLFPVPMKQAAGQDIEPQGPGVSNLLTQLAVLTTTLQLVKTPQGVSDLPIGKPLTRKQKAQQATVEAVAGMQQALTAFESIDSYKGGNVRILLQSLEQHALSVPRRLGWVAENPYYGQLTEQVEQLKMSLQALNVEKLSQDAHQAIEALQQAQKEAKGAEAEKIAAEKQHRELQREQADLKHQLADAQSELELYTQQQTKLTDRIRERTQQHQAQLDDMDAVYKPYVQTLLAEIESLNGKDKNPHGQPSYEGRQNNPRSHANFIARVERLREELRNDDSQEARTIKQWCEQAIAHFTPFKDEHPAATVERWAQQRFARTAEQIRLQEVERAAAQIVADEKLGNPALQKIAFIREINSKMSVQEQFAATLANQADALWAHHQTRAIADAQFQITPELFQQMQASRQQQVGVIQNDPRIMARQAQTVGQNKATRTQRHLKSDHELAQNAAKISDMRAAENARHKQEARLQKQTDRVTDKTAEDVLNARIKSWKANLTEKEGKLTETIEKLRNAKQRLQNAKTDLTQINKYRRGLKPFAFLERFRDMPIIGRFFSGIINPDYARVQERIDSNSKSVARLAQRAISQEEAIKRETTRIQQMQQNAETAKQRTEAENHALETDNKGIKAQIAAKKSEIATMQKTVEALQTQEQNLETECAKGTAALQQQYDAAIAANEENIAQAYREAGMDVTHGVDVRAQKSAVDQTYEIEQGVCLASLPTHVFESSVMSGFAKKHRAIHGHSNTAAEQGKVSLVAEIQRDMQQAVSQRYHAETQIAQQRQQVKIERADSKDVQRMQRQQAKARKAQTRGKVDNKADALAAAQRAKIAAGLAKIQREDRIEKLKKACEILRTTVAEQEKARMNADSKVKFITPEAQQLKKAEAELAELMGDKAVVKSESTQRAGQQLSDGARKQMFKTFPPKPTPVTAVAKKEDDNAAEDDAQQDKSSSPAFSSNHGGN